MEWQTLINQVKHHYDCSPGGIFHGKIELTHVI